MVGEADDMGEAEDTEGAVEVDMGEAEPAWEVLPLPLLLNRAVLWGERELQSGLLALPGWL